MMIIKIISLNIWLGGYLQDSAMSFLKAQDADLVVLQEVFNGEDTTLNPRYRTLQLLKAKLGLPYESFAPDYDQPDKNAQIGNAIISRFPISARVTGDFFYRSEDGNSNNINHSYNLQHVVINTPMHDLDLFNLHGVWDLEGDKFSLKRQAMSSHILEAVKDKKRVILAGDTNARPTNKAITIIGEHLESVFGNKLTTTFNMKHKDNEGYASSAVDMMFVSPSVRVIEHNCLDVDISDHLPLVMTVAISK